MAEVITSIQVTDEGWQWFDSNGNQLHSLEWDDKNDRLVTYPRVAVAPDTVTEPNGTCWIWILSPATWRGRDGYWVGRWPD
jgi:hypothetical protein